MEKEKTTINQRLINALLLNSSLIDNLGLLNGKMGISIFFFLIANDWQLPPSRDSIDVNTYPTNVNAHSTCVNVDPRHVNVHSTCANVHSMNVNAEKPLLGFGKPSRSAGWRNTLSKREGRGGASQRCQINMN